VPTRTVRVRGVRPREDHLMDSMTGLVPVARRIPPLVLDLPDDVLAGLRSSPKRLPSRLLFDDRGAALYERICYLDAYYLARAELGVLRAQLPAIADQVGARARVIEPGAGAGVKTRMLLAALRRPAAYIPIDLNRAQLERTAQVVGDQHPGLEVHPLCVDYEAKFDLPALQRLFDRTLVFFPGSTIGNLEPEAAARFLARVGHLAGPGSLLLLGADSTDDADALLRAYDDEGGVTAEFNRNVLSHVNRTHHATFDPSAFVHRAVWNPHRSRVEMHLVARRDHAVLVGGIAIHFRAGESIVTEHAYKYTSSRLASLLSHAGWNVRRMYTADDRPVRLWLCER
jgi:dimethylhistidine N-methyltransferase